MSKMSAIESGAFLDKISFLTIEFSIRPSLNRLLTNRLLKSLSPLFLLVLHRLSVMLRSLT